MEAEALQFMRHLFSPWRVAPWSHLPHSPPRATKHTFHSPLSSDGGTPGLVPVEHVQVWSVLIHTQGLQRFPLSLSSEHTSWWLLTRPV